MSSMSQLSTGNNKLISLPSVGNISLRSIGNISLYAFHGHFSSVQFSSRWYLCPRKSPYALHPVSEKFPQRCLWNSSKVRLNDDGPLSSFQGRSSSASSFHASLLQPIDGVMSLALRPQVVFQASQHFRSSEKQALCEGCFARQSIYSVIYLHSSVSRAVHPQAFSKVDVDYWHIPLWANSHFTFHFL